MSKKIDIRGIISSHFLTLSNREGKISKIDIFIFYILPIASGLFVAWLNPLTTTAILSLLINIGAILTALLFAVLMQVYNQERSLRDKLEAKIVSLTGKLENTLTVLSQLYSNISYAITCCIALVVSCLLASVMEENKLNLSFSLLKHQFDCPNIYWNSLFLTPFIIFLFFNLMLTMMMVLKRMHALLVN